MGKYDVSPGNALPKRPRIKDAELAGQARSAGLDIPSPDSSADYDFESHTMPSETDLHATPSEVRDAMPETRVLGATPEPPPTAPTLKMKAQSIKAAKPIAQEVAEIKAPKVGDTPAKPLPGQGSKAIEVPKAVQQAGSISDSEVASLKAAGKVKQAPPLTGPKTPKVQAPAPKTKPPVPEAKVMTSEGSVEPIVKPAGGPKPPATGKMTAGDLFGEAPARSIPKMTAGDLFPKPATLGEKFSGSVMGRVAGKAGEAVKGAVKAINPLTEFNELKAAKGAARTSWEVGKALGKGGLRVGRSAVKGLGEGLVAGAALDYAANKGWDVGTAINDTYHAAEDENEKQARQGARYGLKVTGGDSGLAAVGKAALRAGTLGMVDLGSETQVTEDPALKAKFQAKNKKRIDQMRVKP